MADRTSAEIFGMIFDYLAKKKVTTQIKKDAKRFYAKSRHFDFSAYQMDCDESLIKLGLAKYGQDPYENHNEDVILYLAEDYGKWPNEYE